MSIIGDHTIGALAKSAICVSSGLMRETLSIVIACRRGSTRLRLTLTIIDASLRS